jgi:shikimate kinase
MNVVLIGFRCAGKSCAGKMLSAKLGREFVDCDEYIESKTRMTIREIFDISGEAHFRLLEGDAIGELSKLDGKVIATGGGAALKRKNMQNLKRNGIIIYLEVTVDTAYERIQKDPMTLSRRPPLTNQDPYTEIRRQMEFRRPYYLLGADATIHTDGKKIEDVVAEILAFLKERGIFEAPRPPDADAALA